jgi:hypothetical protein
MSTNSEEAKTCLQHTSNAFDMRGIAAVWGWKKRLFIGEWKHAAKTSKKQKTLEA